MRAQRPRIEFPYPVFIPVFIPLFSHPRPRGMTPPRLSTQYNALHYTMHYATTALHDATIHYITISTPQYTILHYNTLQHTTLHHTTLQHSTLHDTTGQYSTTVQHRTVGSIGCWTKARAVGSTPRRRRVGDLPNPPI